MDVWVYRYKHWDPSRDESVVSTEYFTMEAIRAGLGIPLMESGKKVRFTDLDDSGRFRAYAHPQSKVKED